MTPDDLASIGQTLYCLQWQMPLARALGVSDRTVRRWYAGDYPIPGDIDGRLRKLSGKRIREIREVALSLKTEENR